MFSDRIVDFDDPRQVEEYIRLIRETKGVRAIYSESIGEKRSVDLNRYYRVVLEYVARESGHSVAYLHKRFKEKLIPWVKWQEDCKLTTTDLTTEQMMAYLEWIKIFSEDFYGIVNFPDQKYVVRK